MVARITTALAVAAVATHTVTASASPCICEYLSYYGNPGYYGYYR
jgi:hypothetical protein